ECFVFDKRVALGSDLRETKTTQCYACLSPLTVEDQQSPHYDPPHTCPHCHLDEQEQLELRLRNRRRKLDRITSPLPGSIPYNNVRPLNVAQRFDGFTLLDYLRNAHPHLGEGYWERECDEGRIHQKYRPVRGDKPVRAGEQFAHLHPGTTEPDVNAKVEFLYEDDQIVVVNKSAPLPVHPSGRFHRNSLQWILNEVYRPQVLKPAHRLDANTTGLIVFSKTRSVARVLQPQFEEGRVTKTYLALVHGNVEWKQTVCEAAISREPANCGGRTIDEEGGLPSRSRFECLHHNPDGTSLILAVPETGRTNQLRVHLWHLGTPIVGDPLYLPDRRIGTAQTLSVGETMCLHAWKIGFHHPSTNDFTEFETVRPDWARD
ncbi:MAG: pseudouridine synthase, partial [Planctomycetaceae bacterium]|nr:pseudouridine synthase [Planctomycetaceae bacterium]